MNLTCFKEYDIRGELDVNFDGNICYRIGAGLPQVLRSGNFVLGWDARESSPALANSVAEGLKISGANVLDIGVSGTEEMYWAVNEFDACGGIQVTASHNPINFNGLKIVKSGAEPLDFSTEYQKLKTLVESNLFLQPTVLGVRRNVSRQARAAYVKKVLSFVEIAKIEPLTVVINSGHGAAGPTFDAISKELSKRGCCIKFICVQNKPDHTFPNGIPNPMLSDNHAATGQVVVKKRADFGVSFDGDFDRCAIFDEKGKYINGEYVIGLLVKYFLEQSPSARIVHDQRVIWNIEDIIKSGGGTAFVSETGHTNFKRKLRETDAIYGGEISHHHYFKDFARSDSGMIPWLIIAQVLSAAKKSLSDLVSACIEKFPSSGEHNFVVREPTVAIAAVAKHYEKYAINLDYSDGLSVSFKDWRFNIRQSKTESLLRLNVEGRGNAGIVATKLAEISKILKN